MILFLMPSFVKKRFLMFLNSFHNGERNLKSAYKNSLTDGIKINEMYCF